MANSPNQNRVEHLTNSWSQADLLHCRQSANAWQRKFLTNEHIPLLHIPFPSWKQGSSFYECHWTAMSAMLSIAGPRVVLQWAIKLIESSVSWWRFKCSRVCFSKGLKFSFSLEQFGWSHPWQAVMWERRWILPLSSPASALVVETVGVTRWFPCAALALDLGAPGKGGERWRSSIITYALIVSFKYDWICRRRCLFSNQTPQHGFRVHSSRKSLGFWLRRISIRLAPTLELHY